MSLGIAVKTGRLDMEDRLAGAADRLGATIEHWSTRAAIRTAARED
jgi:hypothetical protein